MSRDDLFRLLSMFLFFLIIFFKLIDILLLTNRQIKHRLFLSLYTRRAIK